jgi:hypothetical protein
VVTDRGRTNVISSAVNPGGKSAPPAGGFVAGRPFNRSVYFCRYGRINAASVLAADPAPRNRLAVIRTPLEVTLVVTLATAPQGINHSAALPKPFGAM